MKTIIKWSLLWSIPLLIYIFEIVLVCVKGASLVNNLTAWFCCIWLLLMIAIPSVVNSYKSEKRLKEAEKEFQKSWEEYCKLCDERTDNMSNVEVVEFKIKDEE